MRRWYYPLVWLALFAPPALFELWAITSPVEGDTLSENVWWGLEWLRSMGTWGQVGVMACTVVFAGFFAWLTLHFLLGPRAKI